MQRTTVPFWMENLTDEELELVKQFLLHSGSLKQLANQYNVSYPTVRLRLDRLIQKVQLNEEIQDDSYVLKVKKLAMEDKIDLDIADLLITEYRKEREK